MLVTTMTKTAVDVALLRVGHVRPELGGADRAARSVPCDEWWLLAGRGNPWHGSVCSGRRAGQGRAGLLDAINASEAMLASSVVCTVRAVSRVEMQLRHLANSHGSACARAASPPPVLDGPLLYHWGRATDARSAGSDLSQGDEQSRERLDWIRLDVHQGSF